ncbi:MAG: type III secretion system export apparatus subunit SctU [Succinivibrio sp.]|nr:type III secretion system export apparatus subunit SctU [Succinivibrio sp.]
MSGEKTEQPTPKRLRESREKGDVPKSQELPSAVIVLLTVMYFMLASRNIFDELTDFVEVAIKCSLTQPFDEAWRLLSGYAVMLMVRVVLPLIAVVITASLLSNIAQVGILIAFKGAMPKLSNLNPQKWFKQVFSKKNLFDFCKNVAKVTTLSIAALLAVKGHFRELFMLPEGDIGGMWAALGGTMWDLAIFVIVAFSVIALIDFLYTRMKYTKDHMMSPDEVKREFKESEGDPLIKSKRKQLHQEMINQNTLGNTRKAKVLVVNPTHYAVALDYDREREPIPRILAKGEGDLALRMIEVAKQENIPIMRQATLARALYAEGEEGNFIPEDLFAAVAEVLRFVASLEES